MFRSKNRFKTFISILYALTFLVFILLYTSDTGIGWAYFVLFSCLVTSGLLQKYVSY